jgi:hypothetical protein
MQRRALLATTVAVVAGGCLGAGAPETSRLGWIRLSSERPERSAVDLTVIDAGETVFSDGYQLVPAEKEPTALRVTAPVSGPGQYVVRAVVNGGTHEVETTAAVHDAGGCVDVEFVLQAYGSVETGTQLAEQCG